MVLGLIGPVPIDTVTIRTHRNPMDTEVVRTHESHVSVGNVHIHGSM